ncbi:MAG: hypothetical protein J0I48_19010 [Devosia sp.]|uniref:hypothetical protein n=1 Tax=Devosia sp. 66-22 TaxID=1895753 RepID=UPI001ACE6FF9|nr:hypothetical protein [Devosia sp. 66-22]MBN9348256.1 hypothetical protein [Devosia sp.]
MSILSSDMLGRVLDVVSKRADEKNTEKLRQLEALTSETTDLASLNKAKLQFPWFWVLISIFIFPLGLWWTAVLADSIFGFPFDIADLPTPDMRAWAGDMIRWLFYVGSVTAALKVVSK